MTPSLPPVGTHALLEQLSGYVPDDFIAELLPRALTGGRRHALSAAQLWRVHLLAGLTTTHSLNLIVAQLPEQPAWRRFARLRRVWPTARMLHEFRGQMGVSGLRQINQHLVGRLLRRQGVQPHAVALMDATDLPASCHGFKKKFPRLHRPARGLGRTHAQDWPKPLVCRLQETHVAVVAAHGASSGDAGAAGQLGNARQRGRGRFAGAEPALVSPALGLVAGHGGGRPGLCVGRKQAGGAHRLADRRRHQTACRHETLATLCEPRTGGLSARAAIGMVGTRAGQRATVVSGPSGSGVLSALLGSRALSAPLASRVSGRLLHQVRPWIEPAQSFEKNQLGLGRMFFNSLRLTWQMSLWADSAVLLRTMAWLDTPTETSLLTGLQPHQLEFALPSENHP